MIKILEIKTMATLISQPKNWKSVIKSSQRNNLVRMSWNPISTYQHRRMRIRERLVGLSRGKWRSTLASPMFQREDQYFVDSRNSTQSVSSKISFTSIWMVAPHTILTSTILLEIMTLKTSRITWTSADKHRVLTTSAKRSKVKLHRQRSHT